MVNYRRVPYFINNTLNFRCLKNLHVKDVVNYQVDHYVVNDVKNYLSSQFSGRAFWASLREQGLRIVRCILMLKDKQKMVFCILYIKECVLNWM
jgi:hypothetical protein